MTAATRRRAISEGSRAGIIVDADADSIAPAAVAPMVAGVEVGVVVGSDTGMQGSRAGGAGGVPSAA